MAKVSTTLIIEEDLLRSVERAARRSGRTPDSVIEDALRAHLADDAFVRSWRRSDLPEGEAMAIALEAQRAARRGEPGAL